MARTTRIICIGGAPSSGTTLLADLMDSVPGAACPPELYLYCSQQAYDFDEQFRARSILGEPVPVGASYAAPTPFFNRKYLASTGMDDAALQRMINESADLADFSQRFALQYQQFRGTRIDVLVEKTPINVNCAEQFVTAVPDGLFVHMVRDGRAVVASLVRRGYTIYEAALIWMAQTLAGKQVADRSNVLEVRYEDLVTRPFEIAAEIAAAAKLRTSAAAVQQAFIANTYRAKLPRIESWSVPAFTGTIESPAPYWERLSSKNIAWLESLALYRLDGSNLPREVVSFAGLLRHYGYLPHHNGSICPITRMSQYFRSYLTKTTNYPRQRELRLFMQQPAGTTAKHMHLSPATWKPWAEPHFSGCEVWNDPQMFVQLAFMIAAEAEVVPGRVFSGSMELAETPLRKPAPAAAAADAGAAEPGG